MRSYIICHMSTSIDGRLYPSRFTQVAPGNSRDVLRGSVAHAVLIEGAMETVSKAVLRALVLAAAVKAIADLRVWRKPGAVRGERIARQ